MFYFSLMSESLIAPKCILETRRIYRKQVGFFCNNYNIINKKLKLGVLKNSTKM